MVFWLEQHFPLLLTSVLLGVLVIVVLSYLVAVRSTGRIVQDHRILSNYALMGSTGSGKTCLFYQLRYGPMTRAQLKTAPSMLDNKAGTFKLSSIPFASLLKGENDMCDGSSATKERIVTLIDVPGHKRIQPWFAQQSLPQTGTILFLIDTLAFLNSIPVSESGPEFSGLKRKGSSEKRDSSASNYAHNVVSQLYSILIHPAIRKQTCRILIICTKQDLLPTALSSSSTAILEHVQKVLEGELDTVRRSQHAEMDRFDDHRLGGSRGDAEEDEFFLLGDHEQGLFRFSHIQHELAWMMVSLWNGDDIGRIAAWMLASPTKI